MVYTMQLNNQINVFRFRSPRYLILKGRDDEARRSLAKLLSAEPDDSEVAAEFSEIATNLSIELQAGETSYLDCFRNGEGRNRLRVLTGIALQSLQQLSGFLKTVYVVSKIYANAHSY